MKITVSSSSRGHYDLVQCSRRINEHFILFTGILTTPIHAIHHVFIHQCPLANKVSFLSIINLYLGTYWCVTLKLMANLPFVSKILIVWSNQFWYQHRTRMVWHWQWTLISVTYFFQTVNQWVTNRHHLFVLKLIEPYIYF